MAKIEPKASEEAIETTDNLSEIETLKKQLNDLTNLVKKTGNINKINAYEREKDQLQWFSFSIKLYPHKDWTEKVITKWENTRDFVADEWRIVDQRVRVYYDNNWKIESDEINLVDFARTLKRTDPILAKELKNLDWTPVFIDEVINQEDAIKYQVIRPKAETFMVTLEHNWKDYEIETTYLNS